LLISRRDRTHLCGLGRQNVGVTGVDDGHGGATEELTASGTKLDLYYRKSSSQPIWTLQRLSFAESFFSGLQSINVLQSRASKLLRKTCDSFLSFSSPFFSIGCGTYVVAGEVVDGGLAEHGVVLELRLAERGGVAGDDDELGLAGAEGLKGGLVTKSDLSGLLWKTRQYGRGLVSKFVERAHLDSQRQLGVDAVSGLCSLLRCHCDGIWGGSWAVVGVVVGRLAAEVGKSKKSSA
jgi:hypothetical protein